MVDDGAPGTKRCKILASEIYKAFYSLYLVGFVHDMSTATRKMIGGEEHIQFALGSCLSTGVPIHTLCGNGMRPNEVQKMSCR